MLGKRPCPDMRRTTSMSQLGAGSNIEKSPQSEYFTREKQRAAITIAPHLRAPKPVSNVPAWKASPRDPRPKFSTGVPKANQKQIFSVDAIPEGILGPEPAHPSQSYAEGKFQYASSHSGMQNYNPIVNSVERMSGIGRDQLLSLAPSSPGRGHGVQMVEPARFLQACFLCNIRLSHGQDIYMYRDDRAFCSDECRHKQILIDERKERCSVKVMTTGSVPSDRYQNIGKNVQSGTAKNIQSERRAAA